MHLVSLVLLMMVELSFRTLIRQVHQSRQIALLEAVPRGQRLGCISARHRVLTRLLQVTLMLRKDAVDDAKIFVVPIALS